MTVEGNAEHVAALPLRTTLLRLPSGEIALETGADGVYLLFDCDCLDALPFCRAACCCLPGIDVTPEEHAYLQPNPKAIPLRVIRSDGDAPYEMRRAATGWCAENDPATKRCQIYKDRPRTCRDFHCSRGSDMRGWRLDLNRLETAR